MKNKRMNESELSINLSESSSKNLKILVFTMAKIQNQLHENAKTNYFL